MLLHGRTYRRLGEETILDIAAPTCDYGNSYFDHYRNCAATDVGKKIHDHRRNLVDRYAGDGLVLDYGCGYGEIVQTDTTGRWSGTDVMQATAERLGDRFIASPSLDAYAAVSFFDVLEHIPDPLALLHQVRPGSHVVVVLPCWEHWGHMQDLAAWKHYKPGEHLLYTSSRGFIDWITANEFICHEHGDYESQFGRVDSHTFVLQRLVP